jgi:hypothetical protein
MTFFYLGACVSAFQFHVQVIYIDDTFLTRQYKGQILTIIDMHGNHQMLPLAFIFMENENTDSWYWFFERVKTKVVGYRPDVCLICDIHSCILFITHQLK